MDYNYHTHTFRCGHATGTSEEYVKTAIKGGIKNMGFSEHAPFKKPDGSQIHYRLHIEEIDEYFNELNYLREKYKDKINIKIGFEMEYYPEYFKQMLKDVISYGAEYLILGQHMKADIIKPDEEYADLVVAAIKEGVFSYVAHPDISGPKDDALYNSEMRKICIASREFNTPLEINFLGIREKRRYPDERFWKLAGEEQCPVTFGFDAHDVPGAYDEESLIIAKELVKKYNLNYIGEPSLKLLQNFDK
jgi:histidinol-phosphatase (PHP family)